MGSPETGRDSDFFQNHLPGLSKTLEPLQSQSSLSSSKERLRRNQKIPALPNQASYCYDVLRCRVSSTFPFLIRMCNSPCAIFILCTCTFQPFSCFCWFELASRTEPSGYSSLLFSSVETSSKLWRAHTLQVFAHGSCVP